MHDDDAEFSAALDQFKFFEDYGIPEPVSWLVPQYIPAHGVTILAGAAESGKSFISEELVSAILNKRKLFGSYDVNDDRPIILIDQENDHSTLYERLEKLGGIPKGKLLVFSFDGNFSMDDETLTDALQRIVNDFKPCLIIFDTLRRTYSGNENDSEIVNKLYKKVLKPLSKNACILLIAHTRKPNNSKIQLDELSEIRGTGDIVGLASAVLMLRKNADDTFTIKPLKMRPAKKPKIITVGVSDANNKFVFSLLQNPIEQLTEAEAISEKLLGWLEHNIQPMAEVRTKTMVTAMINEGYGKRNVTAAINLLKNRYVLKQIRRGYYQFVYGDSNLTDFTN